ncbi:MAG: BatD family protein [Bacteroidia bacterium]|nr:BatD family protein [Bacteroidia bacterium]MDW8302418.1 BatD family protein [Bacteroidia bacterium]
MKFWLIVCGLVPYFLFGQSISIDINKTELSTDEPLIITITVKNMSGYIPTPEFPEIENFVSGGISTTMNSTFINGKGTTETKFMKHYYPQKEGKYTIKPFTVEINGIKVTSEKYQLNVKKGMYPPRQPYRPKTPQEIEKEREIQKGKWI